MDAFFGLLLMLRLRVVKNIILKFILMLLSEPVGETTANLGETTLRCGRNNYVRNDFWAKRPVSNRITMYLTCCCTISNFGFW